MVQSNQNRFTEPVTSKNIVSLVFAVASEKSLHDDEVVKKSHFIIYKTTKSTTNNTTMDNITIKKNINKVFQSRPNVMTLI